MSDLLNRVLDAAAAGWPRGDLTDDDIRNLATAMDGDPDEALKVYANALASVHEKDGLLPPPFMG